MADPTHSLLTVTTIAYCPKNSLIMACLLSSAIVSYPTFFETVVKTAIEVLSSDYSPTFSSILQEVQFKKF